MSSLSLRFVIPSLAEQVEIQMKTQKSKPDQNVIQEQRKNHKVHSIDYENITFTFFIQE